MINKLLRNFINIRKMKINNMIVETKSEKEYDELVEEILRRMEKIICI